MADDKAIKAFNATMQAALTRAMFAKLDAASRVLTGRPYASTAKPALPANRAQRRADERVRRRYARKRRKR